MRHFQRTIARFVTVLFLTNTIGCAWMFHGTSDEIHIQSLDPKAELFVNDQPVGIGSATTSVERDKTAAIQAREPGCETRTEQTGSKFDGVSLLGILLDAGIISILVVDLGVTGAAWKTYPLTYTVTPICPPEASPTPNASPTSSPSASPTPTSMGPQH